MFGRESFYFNGTAVKLGGKLHSPGLGVKSVAGLIALAKEKPGALNYATSGAGNSNHIAGELFKAMAGVDIVQVNYRGAPLALNDVLSGRVQMIFSTATAAAPHIAAGKLTARGHLREALGTGSAQRVCARTDARRWTSVADTDKWCSRML